MDEPDAQSRFTRISTNNNFFFFLISEEMHDIRLDDYFLKMVDGKAMKFTVKS